MGLLWIGMLGWATNEAGMEETASQEAEVAVEQDAAEGDAVPGTEPAAGPIVLAEGAAAPTGRTTVTFQLDRPSLDVGWTEPVKRARAGDALELCVAPCRLAVEPGEFRFFVQGEGVVPGKIDLDVLPGAPLVVEGKTRPPTYGVVGQSLGIAGALASIVGVVLLVAGGDDMPAALPTGLQAGGGVAAVTGFVFILSGRSKLKARPAGDPSAGSGER
jgi:hypothetical protein